MTQPTVEHGPGSADPPVGKVLSLVLPALILFPVIFYPLNPDGGIYALTARSLVNGAVLYRDVFAHQGPALLYSYAAALSFGSDPQMAWGILFFFVDLAGAYLMGHFLSRTYGTRGRIVGSLCYATAIAYGASWAQVQNSHILIGEAEDFQALCLTGVLALFPPLEASPGNRKLLAGIGAICGLALFYKPSIAPVIPALAVTAAWHWQVHEKSSGKETLVRLAWAFLGLVGPILLSILYFSLHGALGDYYRSFVLWNHDVRQVVTGLSARNAMLLTFDGLPLAQLGAAFMGVYLTWKARRFDYRLAHALGAGALAAVVWQGHFAHHHWKPFLVWTSCFSGIVICELAALLASEITAGKILAGNLGAVAAILISQNAPLMNARIWVSGARTATGIQSVEDFRAPFHYSTGITYAEISKVVNYLSSSENPADKAYVWGWYSMIPLLAGRVYETPYPNPWTLAVPARDAPKMHGKFMESLLREPPEFLITASFSKRPGQNFATAPLAFYFVPTDFVSYFPEFQAFWKERYEVSFNAGGLAVYKLKSRDPGGK